MKWNNIEYFVTKLSFSEDGNLISEALIHEYDGTNLSSGEVRQRNWIVNRSAENYQISTLNKNEAGNWQRGNVFTYTNGIFTWGNILPLNITKRKAFVSFYHHDDECYRKRFDNLFSDIVVSKSVKKNDIDSDNSDEYIKQLIQRNYLSDVTVLIVLIGSKTRCRKHVDWEISGALNYKIGDRYAGLLGLFLPTHPNFGSETYSYDSVPTRLAANFKSGYAIARDWTDDRYLMQKYIEEAFSRRSESSKIVNKEIKQMTRDTCE